MGLLHPWGIYFKTNRRPVYSLWTYHSIWSAPGYFKRKSPSRRSSTAPAGMWRTLQTRCLHFLIWIRWCTMIIICNEKCWVVKLHRCLPHLLITPLPPVMCEEGAGCPLDIRNTNWQLRCTTFMSLVNMRHEWSVNFAWNQMAWWR